MHNQTSLSPFNVVFNPAVLPTVDAVYMNDIRSNHWFASDTPLIGGIFPMNLDSGLPCLEGAYRWLMGVPEDLRMIILLEFIVAEYRRVVEKNLSTVVLFAKVQEGMVTHEGAAQILMEKLAEVKPSIIKQLEEGKVKRETKAQSSDDAADNLTVPPTTTEAAKTTCQYCETTLTPGTLQHCCSTSSPDGSYFCTREVGHPGDHVACGGPGGHNLKQWEAK